MNEHKIAEEGELEAPSPEEPDDIDVTMEPGLKKEPKLKHFLVHDKSKKVEVTHKLVPGVLSYTYDFEAVTPRDIRYILDATCQTIELDNIENQVSIRLQPIDVKRSRVILNIKNRSNIEIGIMQLWRW